MYDFCILKNSLSLEIFVFLPSKKKKEKKMGIFKKCVDLKEWIFIGPFERSNGIQLKS